MDRFPKTPGGRGRMPAAQMANFLCYHGNGELRSLCLVRHKLLNVDLAAHPAG